MTRDTDDLFRRLGIESREDLTKAIPKATPRMYEALDKYLVDVLGQKPLPAKVKKKSRLQTIQELEGKAKLTAKERRALKNLRIKQRREAKKMKRVEKRLRRRK